MSDKLLISNFTWRSMEMQRAAYPDMPFFIAPDEIVSMLRHTRRQAIDRIHVLSLGCISDNEKDFRAFLKLVAQRGCHLVSKEENQEFLFKKGSVEHIVEKWRVARRNGVAKVGGRISAAKREAESKDACDKIKDRWGLPSKEWPTSVLLKEADLSYNTAIKTLGKRPIAQYNYQAKLKRKANAK